MKLMLLNVSLPSVKNVPSTIRIIPNVRFIIPISANAIIIGGVKIGNNVMIAPGAFVNFDVPDNSIVIGNPGKIIPRLESPTSKYIVYSIDDME